MSDKSGEQSFFNTSGTNIGPPDFALTHVKPGFNMGQKETPGKVLKTTPH
jgi:hypothetical protein